MTMDLHIRRIRCTPYKLVLSRERLIGVFDHNKYVSRANMNDKHKCVVEEVMGNDSITQDGSKR
jgi:hypothetical protein